MSARPPQIFGGRPREFPPQSFGGSVHKAIGRVRQRFVADILKEAP